ncbi:hypothetical protein BDN72DRAFT_842969 [Pluteus cervinus]|uniref:Uncharacterized protein n=1 Tax=Pluteus cervinus TaxID=181527 RepID=A0ACD3AP08_9AGAR|nr:hypothetical protein BDN72DRAFT_842969 [Pluteus cervinus]
MTTTRVFFILFTTLFAGVAVAIPQNSASVPISGGLGPIVTSSTVSSAAAEPSLSPCLQQCFVQALTASGCANEDHACICPSQIYVSNALSCLNANCPDQIPTAEALQSAECAGVVDPSVLSSLDQNSSVAITGSVTANTGVSTTPKPSATGSPSSQGQGQQTSAGAAQPSHSSSAVKSLALAGGNGLAVVVAAVVGLML